MFFVLSSFLLSTYFLSKPERAYRPMEWLNYIVRRFMRIYPLYALILLFYYLLNGVYHHEINSISVIKENLLLQKGSLHFWTIPVEFTFYLFLPIVILFIVLICRMNLKITIGCTILFIAIHQIISPYTRAVESSIHLFQYLPVFIMGCVGALVQQNLRKVSFSGRQQSMLDLLSISLFVGLFLITPLPMKILFGHTPDKYLMNKFIFIGFGCLLLILSVMHGKVIKKLFSSQIMRYFGRISYSGYLIHWIFMQIIIVKYFKGLTLASGLLTFIVTILSATLAHYLIERPCIKVNLLKHKQNTQVPLTAQ